MTKGTALRRDIQLLREVVTKLTQMLSERGLKVTQSGTGAFVKTDPAGKPIRVNLPFIPDNASEDLILAIQGFLDHEVAHVLFTDWRVVARADTISKKVFHLHNIIEDTYIERKMQERFPGSKANLTNVQTFLINEFTNKAMGEAKTPQDIISALLVPAFRAWAGQPVFQEYMADKWHHMAAITTKCDDLTKKVALCNSSEDCLELTMEFVKRLETPPEKEKPESEDDSDGESCGSGKSVSGGKSGSSGSKSDVSGGSKGGKAKGKKGAKDGSGDADGGTSSAGGDSASGDGSSGSKSAGESKDEGDDGDDGRSADDEVSGGDGGAEAAGEDPLDEGASGGGEDSGDGSDEDGGEDGEGEGEDSGSDGDDKSDASSSDDGEGDEDDPLDDLGDDDGRDDGDRDDMGDPDDWLDEGDESGEGPTDPGDPEDESEGGMSGEGSEPEPLDDASKDMLDAIESDKTKDFDDAVSETISSKASDESRGADYLVYTKDADRIEPFNPPEHTSHLVTKMEEDTRAMVGVMQKELERIMAAKSRVLNIGGFRSGRLHGASLARMAVKDDRVFRRRQESKSKDVAVGLLVDCSGSMGGGRIEVAGLAAFALAQVLDRIGVTNEVLGFTTHDDDSEMDWDQMREEEAKMGRSYSRSEPIWMPILKSFSERMTPEVRRRFAALKTRGIRLDQNLDGECVEIAATRLLPRRESRKVLMVLSDGSPCAAGDIYAQAAHLTRVVQQCEKMGVECVGIGIQTSAVTRFYKKHVVLNDLTELPTEVMKRLREILA